VIALIPLLVLVIGLALYYRTTPPADPRTANIGLHMFWVGLLVFLMQMPQFVLWLQTGRLLGR
jgi:hypothetical protein